MLPHTYSPHRIWPVAENGDKVKVFPTSRYQQRSTGYEAHGLPRFGTKNQILETSDNSGLRIGSMAETILAERRHPDILAFGK